MKKTLVVGAHALVLWMLCGGTMAVGRSLLGLKTALVVHAVAAPFWAALVSRHYFRMRASAAPLPTALIFLGFTAAADAGLVAPVFEKSFMMFRSVIGVWLPFGLIFLTTLLTGIAVRGKHAQE